MGTEKIFRGIKMVNKAHTKIQQFIGTILKREGFNVLYEFKEVTYKKSDIAIDFEGGKIRIEVYTVGLGHGTEQKIVDMLQKSLTLLNENPPTIYGINIKA